MDTTRTNGAQTRAGNPKNPSNREHEKSLADDARKAEGDSYIDDARMAYYMFNGKTR